MRRVMLTAAWIAVAATVLAAPLGATSRLPEKIALPNAFQPEGVAISEKGTFYVGSIPTGAIYRGSIKTGQGAILNPGGAGRAATGVELDDGKLFVAGAGTGKGFVYSARSGELLATHTFTTATDTFINDVAVARGGAYFTDSRRQVLYRVGRGGVEEIPLTGDIQFIAGFNANGIEAARDGKALIVVQSNKGKLFKVDPRSGETREIVLNEPVMNGDGILLDGRTLYVVQNFNNRVAVVKLNRRLTSGTVITHLTDPDFDVPTTIDDFGERLYAVNARFRPQPPPPTEFWLAQFRKVNDGRDHDDDDDD
ncbi:MAG: SMP-30/gluconolactonase/LRE family protein [Gaiellales bacterium]